MKAFLKGYYPLIIATLCLILCICVLIPLGIREEKYREIYYDYSATVDKQGIYLEGYEWDGDRIVCKSEDGYIYLPVTDEEINDVAIYFSKGYKGNCDVKLEYVWENSVQNGENYVSSSLKNGDTELYFSLDKGVYKMLRCHIDGSFEIEKIVLSHITSEKIATKDVINYRLLIIGITVSLLLYGAFTTVFMIKKKKK